ncbi:MAG TPA: pitrilysin family protein [Candidatus Obscuribacterales bacterium]
MRMKNRTWLIVCLCWLAAATAVCAEAQWKKPLIPVTKDFTLANGLRVVVSEDHSVPVAALALVYDVGARNEQKGRSGFAHLFEHMMFEGSENVGKTEHFKYVESAGGSVNASTHPDFTDYWEKLPSNQIELALWLEADRMRSLKVTQENFRNQLETVKEEKRSRIDNQPYSPSYITFQETLFDNWNNAHPTIGSFEDLEDSSVEDVRKFFKTYYAPNNAVMAIVGDVDAGQIEKLVHKYFDSIPGQPEPPKPDVAEPVQTKPKRVTVKDAHAQLPGFWIGWKAPARREPDYYALGVLENILSAGDSSRLYQRMVKGDQVALRADMWYDERRGPGAFSGFVMYKPGNTADKVREILLEEINKLKATPPTAEEVEKAKNQILRGAFAASGHKSLQRSLGRAQLLAEYTMFFGDPKYLDEDLEKYMGVTAEDVQRVARKIFTPEGMTVVDVEPARSKAEAPAAGPGGAAVR